MEEDEPTSPPPPPSLLTEPNPLEAESGHVTVSVKGGGPSSLEEVESVATSSSSETLEELVDQMEIEISDHEGEGSGDESSEVSEEKVGVVLDSGGGEGEEVVMSEKMRHRPGSPLVVVVEAAVVVSVVVMVASVVPLIVVVEAAVVVPVVVLVASVVPVVVVLEAT